MAEKEKEEYVLIPCEHLFFLGKRRGDTAILALIEDGQEQQFAWFRKEALFAFSVCVDLLLKKFYPELDWDKTLIDDIKGIVGD